MLRLSWLWKKHQLELGFWDTWELNIGRLCCLGLVFSKQTEPKCINSFGLVRWFFTTLLWWKCSLPKTWEIMLSRTSLERAFKKTSPRGISRNYKDSHQLLKRILQDNFLSSGKSELNLSVSLLAWKNVHRDVKGNTNVNLWMYVLYFITAMYQKNTSGGFLFLHKYSWFLLYKNKPLQIHRKYSLI